jgi:hypothetical protein
MGLTASLGPHQLENGNFPKENKRGLFPQERERYSGQVETLDSYYDAYSSILRFHT